MAGTVLNLQTIKDAFYAALSSMVLTTTTQTSALAPTPAGSKTIPANVLIPGTMIRIWGAGYYSLPLLGGTASIQVKVNGSVVASVTTSALLNSSTNKPFEFIVRLLCRNGGVAIASGHADYTTATGARVVDNIDDPISTFQLDPSVDNTIDVLFSWDSPATGKSVTVTQSTINVSARG